MYRQTLFFFFLLALGIKFQNQKFIRRYLQTSSECSNRGYLYQNICFCQSQWQGNDCSKTKVHEWFDTDTQCDDLVNKLDHLINISPEFYPGDDDQFSRFYGKQIGKKWNNSEWIRMHDYKKDFQIFGESIRHQDIKQGALGDCYALSAYACLANIRNGQLIRDMFMTKKDNDNHVYVTRWLIDGKPRYVAVDQWIPGKNGQPIFLKVFGDSDFWGIILEKAWAKIHGNYQKTEAGWMAPVWESITSAPGYRIYHSDSKFSTQNLFTFIQNLLKSEYPVSTATIGNLEQNLVQSHAYSVLNTYEIKLENSADSQTQQLYQVFNPWAVETWNKNPWADDKPIWSDFRKSQVDYLNRNDGTFYLSAKDFQKNFGITEWAEIQEDYEVSFIDIALKQKENTIKTYYSSFELSIQNPEKPVYVFIDKVNYRLLKSGCGTPFWVYQIKVKNVKNNKTYQGNDGSTSRFTVKLENTTNGTYEVESRISQDRNYHKFITLATYAPKGSVKFNEMIDNDINYNKKKCPDDCSLHGRCNSYNGKCFCYKGWGGAKCEKQVNRQCLHDCNGNGKCDYNTGICTCKMGFHKENCLPCSDEISYQYCHSYADKGYCKSSSSQHSFMQEKCPYTCGGRGYEGFGNCYAPFSLCKKNNCNNKGTCDPKTGLCHSCETGYTNFNYKKCEACTDDSQFCKRYMEQGDCEKTSINFETMQYYCRKTCGEAGYEGFGSCYNPKDKCKNVNCGKNGECDQATGKCKCKKGFYGKNCSPCQDVHDCTQFALNGACAKSSIYFDWMKKYCQKTCGEMGYEEFGKCYLSKEQRCEILNCGQNGQCDLTTGSCKCNKGYTGKNCLPCQDIHDCNSWQALGFCEYGSPYFDWMILNCRKTCGSKGIKEYGSCAI